MNKYALFIAFIGFICEYPALAQTNGDIIRKEKVKFPIYSSIEGIDWHYPENTYNQVIHDSRPLRIFSESYRK